jgi:hypothetical protein
VLRHVITEYKEFLIPIACALYSYDVFYRVNKIIYDKKLTAERS